jgi:hypothetical protein
VSLAAFEDNANIDRECRHYRFAFRLSVAADFLFVATRRAAASASRF